MFLPVSVGTIKIVLHGDFSAATLRYARLLALWLLGMCYSARVPPIAGILLFVVWFISGFAAREGVCDGVGDVHLGADRQGSDRSLPAAMH
eukprot:14909769-Alexandrium_andersonii.AAC.1